MLSNSKDGAYSVRSINMHIDELIRNEPGLSYIWVTGEVTNVSERKGHLYFSLTERAFSRRTYREETWKLDCAMWASDRKTGQKFPLKDGMVVFVYGSVRLWPQGGKYSLNADRIEQAADTEGRNAAMKRQLVEKLRKLGWFDEPKKPIPRYAHSIGVAASATGDAVRDIIKTARKRNPGIRILVYDCFVQSEKAPQSIAAAVHSLDRAGVDVIIVSRGGGSRDDLEAFNTELVADAIHDCRTPVISAVGHTADRSISDDIADWYDITPTAAAQTAVPDVGELVRELGAGAGELNYLMSISLRSVRHRADNLSLKMAAVSPQKKLQLLKQALENYRSVFETQLPRRIREARQQTAKRQQMLEQLMQRSVRNARNRSALTAEQLNGLDPYRKMKSGFAFLTDGRNKRIRSVSDTADGELIHLYLTDGRIDAVITHTEKKN